MTFQFKVGDIIKRKDGANGIHKFITGIKVYSNTQVSYELYNIKDPDVIYGQAKDPIEFHYEKVNTSR